MELLQTDYVVDRLFLINRLDLSSYCGKDRVRVVFSLDDNIVKRGRKLAVRQVDLHWGFLVE